MGIQTTYKCDNNGCGNIGHSLDGWFGISTRTTIQPDKFSSVSLFQYGPDAGFYDVDDHERLACSESCALSMAQRHMAAHRPAKGQAQ